LKISIEDLNAEIIEAVCQDMGISNRLVGISPEYKELKNQLLELSNIEKVEPRTPIFSAKFLELKTLLEELNKKDNIGKGVCSKMFRIANSIDECLILAPHIYDLTKRFQLYERAFKKAVAFREKFYIAVLRSQPYNGNINSQSLDVLVSIGTLKDWYDMLINDSDLLINIELYDFIKFAKRQIITLIQKNIITKISSEIKSYLERIAYLLTVTIGPKWRLDVKVNDHHHFIRVSTKDNDKPVAMIFETNDDRFTCFDLTIVAEDMFSSVVFSLVKTIKENYHSIDIPADCLFTLKERDLQSHPF